MGEVAPALTDDKASSIGYFLHDTNNKEDEDEKTSEVLMEIQKLENILLEQLDKESTFAASSVAFHASKSTYDDESSSDFDDGASNATLRKELNQVVTPYGHVSQRVQLYEDLQEQHPTTLTNPSAATTPQRSDQQETLLSQTTKIKSMLEKLERQLLNSDEPKKAANAATSVTPTADIQNSIQSLSHLEQSLKKANSSHELLPVAETRSSSNNNMSWPDDQAQQPPQRQQLSSSHMDNHNRLHSIRHNLWGGTPIRRNDNIDNDDDSLSTVSISAQAASGMNHHHHYHHRPPKEETCCFPNEQTSSPETPIQPRDDYFSSAYQSTFSTAYRLDLPETHRYYYYNTEQQGTENVACCRIPPLERLLTALKRLEHKVASCKRRPILHTFREQEEYELADLDLTNPAIMERYKEL